MTKFLQIPSHWSGHRSVGPTDPRNTKACIDDNVGKTLVPPKPCNVRTEPLYSTVSRKVKTKVTTIDNLFPSKGWVKQSYVDHLRQR